jgi:hypothetical protein
MSNTRRRNAAEGSPSWAHFRRTCGLLAQERHTDTERSNELSNLEHEVRREPFSELFAEFKVQLEVQRRLATEYAAALVECKRLQDDINRRSMVNWDEPCAELDGRLEREVLELAVCEEAYELVSEELDLVRSELQRRGLPAH